MQYKDLKSEIQVLELQLAEKEILLETFLNSNEVFHKSKEILHEIKGVKERLAKFRTRND
jgi:hypothetical protein